MNYIEAVDYIHSLLKFGVRPGLNGMDALLHFLGNPEKEQKFIHVAGTNGKGSTSAALSNVLIDAGYRVGLYTSPYVTEFLERVQFCGEPIDKNVFSKAVEKVKNAVEALVEDGITITEFEALTACAFICFKHLNCEVVVLEVGLGGRLDATNVIGTPLVNVITSLSIDHSAILGNTIEKIAFEKCGTIKEKSNVICSFGQPDGALEVVTKTVFEKKGTLVIPDEKNVKILKSDVFGTDFLYKNELYEIAMAGVHQVKNMACVIEACEILKKYFEIRDENVKRGIKKTILPARVEVLSQKPLVILDGGHNADGAKAFFEAVLPGIEKKDHIITIAGMMADKEVEQSLRPLMEKTEIFFAVTPDNPRAMSSVELAKIAGKYSGKVFAVEDVREAVKIAFHSANDNSAIFVVGSLYLAGEVREFLIDLIKN